ncbi:MAG: allophanate hydrolase subunit 1 [Candidatus Acidiferrum sp.]
MATSALDGVRFLPASDQSLMVYFGERITLAAHERVVRFLRLLLRRPIDGVRNLHPAYCSVLVKFDALRWTHSELEVKLRESLSRLESVSVAAPREVTIPVCYEAEFAPDLPDVCSLLGLTSAQVIERHCSLTYLVYFLGFLPGFAYLGPLEGGCDLRPEKAAEGNPAPPAQEVLPAALNVPRLATPRRNVPAGSVGIAGGQTGVYPFATPGGWRLIGRTPMKMFREENGTSALSIGDHVRFVAIPRERFADWERK